MTLIAAAPGFGKTTLLSEWVAELQTGNKHALLVAWLSLDEEDSNPTRFLIYMIAALRAAVPKTGEELLAMLQSSQSAQLPPLDAMLTSLLNEITAVPGSMILVLDDYHLIDAKPIDDAITFLLEHMPPQMHLVIATREDPQLPLHRLRARGQLTELRAAELQFTASEAADFLNRGMGLDLTPQEIETLEKRTEGWIAGLQLAALSMQGRKDVPAFIQAFAGDHRYIADYLIEEVLRNQPESVRTFLLRTSILDRLCGSLCDAVIGRQEVDGGGGSQAQLEALERGNFFVIPLDDNRQWYRYHHLFAEVLRAHLTSEAANQPDLVTTLHRRASEWYEHNSWTADGMPQAIRHALAAGDFERAANLAERTIPAVRRSRQEPLLLGWLKALPDELFHVRPVLSVWYAHALLSGGELAGVEDRLRSAERWLGALHAVDTADTRDARADAQARVEASAQASAQGEAGPRVPSAERAGMVVADEEEFRRLPGAIAIARAGLAMALGDVAATVRYARRVLEVVPEDDHISRGGAEAFLGLAAWLSGDLDAAYSSYANGIAHMQMAGHTSDAVGGATTLADIRIAQGRLNEAMRAYERGLQLAEQFPREHGEPPLRGTADMYVGMSELLCERNDLDGAAQHLLKSKELGEHTGFARNRYRWCVAMARIREAQGDLDGAVDLLNEAERVYVSDFFPNVRPIPALRARVLVGQGKLGEAMGWAREQDLSAEDDLSYLREFEYITLARLLLAKYKGDPADHVLGEILGLLARLLPAAEEGGRTGSVIEILVLLSLAHQAHGDTGAALAPLERALTLAEPEGYVRVFVSEGAAMAVLLEEASKHRIAPRYVERLLAAGSWASSNSGLAQSRDSEVGERSQDWEGRERLNQALIEPLSERELDVLRLLKTDLSGPEIARELMVSLNTTYTHTKNIYTKLGVNNRRAAVRRAEELRLL